jgi:drug/metabolite transporter (DMT)-like permease
MISQRQQNVRGIFWMIAAVAALSVMDATMKSLVAHYPPLEVAALRGAVCVPVVLAWVALRGGLRQVARVRWRLQLLRAALGVFMVTAFVGAVRALPLTEAYSIFFVAPLLITALSVPLLGERVDARRWMAIVVGFVGVLVVLRPTGEGALTFAGLAVLAASIAYALSAILLRVLGRTDSTLASVLWFVGGVAIGASALAAPHWVPVERRHWPLLAALASSGAIGQFAITEAFRRAEVSVIAPLEYSALVWGLLFDALLWSTRPDATTIVGAAIVVGAGIYLIRQERAARPA